MKIKFLKKPKRLLIIDNSKLPQKEASTNITKRWAYHIDSIRLGVITKYKTKKGYKFKIAPVSITPSFNRYSETVEERGYQTDGFKGLKEASKALKKALIFEANLIFTIE